MRRALLASALLAALAGGASVWPARGQDTNRGSDDDPQSFDLVRRGQYLTTVGDCVACHTAPGGQPFAGGRPVETPFGTLISPNLTPDVDTGLGSWTDAEFIRAVKHGIARGGEHIYPALPYVYYTKVADDDVRAIRAYLNTLTPVHNAVQDNQLPFPFDVRASLAGWNALFFKPGDFQPDPHRSAEWNRGAYLVEGLGHCAACHTAKNTLGGDETGHELQGGVLQGWYAPAIEGDPRRGLGSWSADEVVEYLKTGQNDRQQVAGPMAEVVKYSTSKMTDADLHAIAAYLKSLPGPPEAAPRPQDGGEPAMKAGAAIYADACSACHTPNGAGIPHLFPSLAGSASVQSDRPTTLIRVVLQGVRAGGSDRAPTSPAMPAFGWKLNDAEVAAVLTFIRNAWGNAAPAVAAEAVTAERSSLASRTQ